MKAKVHSWKANLNDIKQSYVEIEKIPDTKIYKATEPDEYSLVKIFAEYKGIYFEIAHITQHRLEDLIHQKSFKNDINDGVIKARYLSGYPNYLVLKVIELSGEDVKPYLVKRAEHIAERERKDKERDDERAKADEEREAREKEDQQKRFEILKTNLIADKYVLMEDLIEYAKFHNIKIHPRTLGSIYKNNDGLEVSQTMVRFFYKKTRKSTLLSFTKLAQSIVETF